jgi:hypothetical protein
MGSKKKIREPINPTGLMKSVVPTSIPGVNTAGSFGGIRYNPNTGTEVGIDDLESLRRLSLATQGRMNEFLPDLGKLASSDISSGNELSRLLYGQGADLINENLSDNINSFREDAFRRGMAASSSYLSGMKKLYDANARSLGGLLNDSQINGLNYAAQLAQMRSNAFNQLGNMNNNLFYQTSEFPLQAGLQYSLPQARLWDANKQLNSNRLRDYYGMRNDSISNYNNAMVGMQRNEKSFLGGLLNNLL